MESYQQLAYEQRCQISVLTKRGCPQRDIAESVGVRELARNTGERVVIGEREKNFKTRKNGNTFTLIIDTKFNEQRRNRERSRNLL